MTVAIDIITCPQWGARIATAKPIVVAASERIIFHHTAGHHAEIAGPATESREEAIQYARAIQNYHMDHNGWNDSGHNFLVCRSGLILQGRWLTVSAIESRHMVVSAHCPGQNEQIGIEHEHRGTESMTPEQHEASARLQAWIASQYGRKLALGAYPHQRYFNTSCPANLAAQIPSVVARAQSILNGV